jgi:FMN phosphatase YigB (HAD superfamily)
MFCGNLPGTVKIKEKSLHVKVAEMHAGRYPPAHDIVVAMLTHFFRKSGESRLELDNIRAVLFDLDGTLLDVNMHRFVPNYLRRLTENMGPQINPAHATRALHQAVAAMFANVDAGITLENVLLEVLQSELGISPEDYRASLARFCSNDLESLRPMVTGHPLARQLIEVSLKRDWQVVLATNPIFPRAVIDARLAWAGLDGDVFHHVTDYETAHFCKPNPLYFEEIIGRLQLPASACLMVGNDPLHDLAASQLGMQTCLLTLWSISRSGSNLKADWQGSHEELLAVIEKKGPTTAHCVARPD